jgi:hypothetical protein
MMAPMTLSTEYKLVDSFLLCIYLGYDLHGEPFDHTLQTVNIHRLQGDSAVKIHLLPLQGIVNELPQSRRQLDGAQLPASRE